jgi:hypothetical protein
VVKNRENEIVVIHFPGLRTKSSKAYQRSRTEATFVGHRENRIDNHGIRARAGEGGNAGATPPDRRHSRDARTGRDERPPGL